MATDAPDGTTPTKPAEVPAPVEAGAPAASAAPAVEPAPVSAPRPEAAPSPEPPPTEAPAVPAPPTEAPAVQAPPDAPTVQTPALDVGPPSPAVAGAPIEIHLVGKTDVGLVREHNEDNFTLVRLDDDAREPERLLRHHIIGRGTLLCVCDGMGGAAAGEVASSMAVATVPEILRGDQTASPPQGVVDDEEKALARKLRFAAEEANRRIFAEQQQNLARSGMGTTMTAAVLRSDRVVIAQVGDSRCYVYRRGKLTQVTRDQSLVNQLLETGQITAEQAKYFEHSNVILQALGVQEDVEVQLSRVALRRGDRIMLCSDGLVGVVSDEEIAAVLGSVDDPGEAARLLIELANGNGGPDNITVVVAYVGGQGLAEPGLDDLIEYQTWIIDPVVEQPSEPEGFGAPEAAPDAVTLPEVQATEAPEPAPPPEVRALRPVELFSMATVIGLIVFSMLVGAAMYRRAVPCRVRAARAGLVVTADGRDSGARTVEGEVAVRLRPGHHRVALASARRGAEAAEVRPAQDVEVREGDACLIRFDEAAAAAPEGAEAPAAAPAADHAEAAAGSPR